MTALEIPILVWSLVSILLAAVVLYRLGRELRASETSLRLQTVKSAVVRQRHKAHR